MSQRAFEREAQRRERAEARRTNIRRRRAGLAAGAVGAAVLFAPSAASAASFEVNTVADNGPGDCNTTCTLRDAITVANTNADPSDVITFSSAVTGAADPTIYLVDGQLEITSAITITGPGADNLAISGKASAGAVSSNSRIFQITGSGDARISGLTLTDGNGATDGTSDGFGGAIDSQGKLTLTDSIVTGNNITGGGFFGLASGGGISVSGGEALVDSSEVTSNTAQSLSAAGGGIANYGGTLTVRDSSVTQNGAEGQIAFGGGIAATSETNVENTHVDGNHASGNYGSGGGGISTNDAKFPYDIFLRSSRGASSAQIRITDSTVSDNEADYGGGINSDFSSDKYQNSADGVTIVRTTIDGNTATYAGGGMAVANQQDGNDVTVRDTTVSNNRVEQEERVPARGPAPEPSGTGGGIDFGGQSKGDSLVSNSTVSNNSAAEGGGIHAGTLESLSSRAERALNESPSLSRLLEKAEQEAPAEVPENRGTTTTPEPPPPPPTGSLVVSNTTVASNDAADTGGGVSVDPSATDQASTKLSSTIVGNNNANGAANDLATSGAEGLEVGYSLIEQTGSAAVTPIGGQPNVNGQDPVLGSLTDNGGPTLTHLPAGSSPAIDAGIANLLATDQRGLPRTQDRLAANVADGTDIGAVEIPGETTPTPSRPVTPSSTPTICGRRAISLVRADIRGKKVKLTGLVGSKFYGKTVTIQTDPKGAKNSAFTKTGTVKASKTGSFSVSVPKPAKDDIASVRYRAVIGSAKSPALKLPQSLTSRSVKSAKGTITVKGKVKLSVLGKRNKVKIRRLVCGRYRTVGSATPDTKGNYTITFKSTTIRGVAFYRAESKVLRKPGSKVYVIQYARAIAIKTTSQTG